MSRPLDVCFVLPSLAVGGAERVVVNLANGLLAAGHAPRLLLTDRDGPLSAGLAAGVPVRSFDRSRVRSALPRLLRELRRRPPDVLVSTHTHVNLLLCAVRPLLPRSMSLVLREPIHAAILFADAPSSTRQRQRQLYSRADLVITTSSAMQQDLDALIGRPTMLLPNAVDVEEIRRIATLGLAGDAPSYRSHARNFVAVGRLTAQKAYPDLFAAFARIADPDDRLTVFGEGPLTADLMGLIDELKVGGKIHLAGIDPMVWTHVARADAFVLASTHEGMPNAALEALALGTPVLATTELDVLEDLRAAAPAIAVTLVARADLATAMAAVPSGSTAGTPLPRPSLLPPSFGITAVVDVFAAALSELTAARLGARRA